MNFPQITYPQLYHGCLLASVVHAVMMTRCPSLSHEHSWDGRNYSVQDSAGTRGTVSFAMGYCVAVFRDDHSERSSSPESQASHMDLSARAMPENIAALAQDEAFQYLLEEIESQVRPSVTAAFWIDYDTLSGPEDWEMIRKHGAHLITIQIQDEASALTAWTEDYEMPPKAVTLSQSLYRRRILEPNKPIFLSQAETATLLQLAEDEDALHEAYTSLAEIQIFA